MIACHTGPGTVLPTQNLLAHREPSHLPETLTQWCALRVPNCSSVACYRPSAARSMFPILFFLQMMTPPSRLCLLPRTPAARSALRRPYGDCPPAAAVALGTGPGTGSGCTAPICTAPSCTAPSCTAPGCGPDSAPDSVLTAPDLARLAAEPCILGVNADVAPSFRPESCTAPAPAGRTAWHEQRWTKMKTAETAGRRAAPGPRLYRPPLYRPPQANSLPGRMAGQENP